METYIKELVTNIELTNFENTSLKKELKEQKSMTLKLDAENKFLKEKLVSLETSVHDLENQMIEQKSITKSEIASMEKYMKESVTNIELIISEKTLKLEAENNLMKEKIVSFEKSVHDLENQKIEQISKIKSEIQESNPTKRNPEVSNCLGVFGLSTRVSIVPGLSQFLSPGTFGVV